MTLRGTTSNSQTNIGVVTPSHFSLLGKKKYTVHTASAYKMKEYMGNVTQNLGISLFRNSHYFSF